MHPSIFDTGIIDLLEADPRPSLIVALEPHPPTVVYTNPAFSGYPAILDLITSKSEDCGQLWKWITGVPPSSDSQAPPLGPSFVHSNVYWTRSVVNEQMVVVGANQQIPSSVPPPAPPRKVRLDVPETQGGGASPAKRIIPGESDVVRVASEGLNPGPALLETDRRTKSTPGNVPIGLKERPPSRAEAVQSLGRSVSDPGWILPDTTPGRS